MKRSLLSPPSSAALERYGRQRSHLQATQSLPDSIVRYGLTGLWMGQCGQTLHCQNNPLVPSHHVPVAPIIARGWELSVEWRGMRVHIVLRIRCYHGPIAPGTHHTGGFRHESDTIPRLQPFAPLAVCWTWTSGTLDERRVQRGS